MGQKEEWSCCGFDKSSLKSVHWVHAGIFFGNASSRQHFVSER